MNIQQLRYISTTLDTGSFASAANALFVTPGAVSKAIGELEKELGVKFFERDGRTCKPTELTLLLNQTIKNVISDIDSLVAITRGYKAPEQEVKHFIFAIADSPARSKLIDNATLRELEALDPKRHITILRSSSGSCLSAVEDKSIDAALVHGTVDRPHVTSLVVEIKKLVAVVNKQNKLANLHVITPHDLINTPIGRPHDIRYCYPRFREAFESIGAQPVFHDIPDVLSNINFINNDQGCLIISDEPEITSLYKNAAFVLLQGEAFTVPISLVFKTENTDPLLTALYSFLKKSKSQTEQK